MTKQFDTCVFIGRLNPVHLGHRSVILKALDVAEHLVLCLGSAGSARTIRNPFTYQERAAMVRSMFSDEQNARIHIRPLYDMTYQDSKWIAQVQTIVKDAVLSIFNPPNVTLTGIADLKIALIGAEKDNTSYYLKLFPQWESVAVPVTGQIHATSVRNNYLTDPEHFQRWFLVDNVLHKAVYDFMLDFIDTDAYKHLHSEKLFVDNYKKQWQVAKPVNVDAIIKAAKKDDVERVLELVKEASGPPYPAKHVTVDAVVEQSGHILLVKRRSSPGKGLWAIPGGHLEEDEPIMTGILRELREETKITVPSAVLLGRVVQLHVFDDVNRSTIGRVVTHAAHIRLTDNAKLPKIKGSDDALKAKWIPISEIREDVMFDDHFHVINYFLGV